MLMCMRFCSMGYFVANVMCYNLQSMSGNVEYQAALDYLYSFVDYSMTRSFRWSADKFDLQRMDDLMAALGHPEREYPILHIAGTKGKGSVAAMCESVIRSAGYRVGLYTSPHMHDYAERIRVNGVPIPHQVLIDLINEVRSLIESIKELTTFEITTALGFLYFARQHVQAAVIEVGLGGRLDATNITMPAVCVITSISYDHMQILGNTLAEIAGEKAGIIKPGIPVVMAPQHDEARLVIEKIARERQAPLIEVGAAYRFTPQEGSLQGQSLTVWRESDDPQKGAAVGGWGTPANPARISITLLGMHQVENAATAYTALDTFQRVALSLSMKAIQEGFSETVWPGRFEILNLDPTLIVDCAHNRESAARLRQTMQEYFPDRLVTLVFGASEDKDIAGMLAELAPITRQIILTRSFHPRAAEPEQLAKQAQESGLPARIVPEAADALESALKYSEEGEIILATGSIFIATAVREAWLACNGIAIASS
jgi:dihydrofolate synthase/folylpolyglutamate synthase